MDWYPYNNEIECRCNEEKGLTFSNTFFVPSNTIDFSSVFLKFSPQDQAAVLSIIIVVMVLFLILLVWARHQDKKDIVKVKHFYFIPYHCFGLHIDPYIFDGNIKKYT